MRYRLDDMVAFVQVVETGSISAAARRLNLAKSVVSKRITDLEAELGVELLHRSTRRVAPTDRGEVFYRSARTILQQLDEAVEAVSESEDDLCGQLRVTAPMSFGQLWLGPALFPLFDRHPRLELALELDDRVRDLYSEGYDLGIRIGHLADSTLVARKLTISQRVVCCSPGYADHAGLPATVEALAEHACIGYSNVSSGQVWRFEPAVPDGEIRSLIVRSRITTNNGEAMRDAAIAGLGIAVLPLFIVHQALKSGALIDVLPNVRPTPDTIYAIYPKRPHVPKKIRAVIEQLRSAFGGKPPWEDGAG